MEEKYMVNDIIENLKNIIKSYTEGIIEGEKLELRDVIKELRNSLENFQYDLYKISESKGYNIPTSVAELKEVQKIKQELNIE